MGKFKEVEELVWLYFEKKTILLIGHKWTGNLLIACPYDMLIIPKSIFKKYEDCFLPKFLQNAKVIFIEDIDNGS